MTQNIEEIKRELHKFLEDNKQYYYVDHAYDDVHGNYVIKIDVDWGDWKHDHIYIDNLVQKFFDEKGIKIETGKSVTAENGTDAYSATHYYRLLNDDKIEVGMRVKTPRFGTVRIEKVFDNQLAAYDDGYTEPTYYTGSGFGIAGKHAGLNQMTFCAYNITNQ